MNRQVKDKIKKYIPAFLTAVILFAAIGVFGKFLRPVETDINVSQINTFHSLPKDSIEVLCVGSSRMWRGLDTMELYDRYGIGAYNYSCNWQHINTTELFIDDALRTQSPKLIVIETANANLPLMDVDMDGEIYYTRKIPWSYTKYRCIRQYFGRNLDRYFSYFIPLSAFHENWQNVTKDNFADDDNVHVDFLRDVEGVGQDEFLKTMGFGETYGETAVSIESPDNFSELPFESYATDVLDRITSKCAEKGIDILFVTMPYEGEYEYSDAMSEYAASKGCGYINLFEHLDDMGIDEKTDFCDHSHFNTKGAVKAADYIGQYIDEHYALTDYRDISDNLWEEAKRR